MATATPDALACFAGVKLQVFLRTVDVIRQRAENTPEQRQRLEQVRRQLEVSTHEGGGGLCMGTAWALHADSWRDALGGRL